MLKIVGCDDDMAFVKIILECHCKSMSLFVECCFNVYCLSNSNYRVFGVEGEKHYVYSQNTR